MLKMFCIKFRLCIFFEQAIFGALGSRLKKAIKAIIKYVMVLKCKPVLFVILKKF